MTETSGMAFAGRKVLDFEMRESAVLMYWPLVRDAQETLTYILIELPVLRRVNRY